MGQDQPIVGPDGISRLMQKSLLHLIMVTFDHLNQQSALRVLSYVVLLAVAVGAVWGLAVSSLLVGLLIISTILAATALDLLTLSLAPRLKISFGPWKGQLLPLTICRIAAATCLVALTPLFSVEWSIYAVIGVQLLGVALLVWGMLVEPAGIQLTHRTIPVPHWPQAAPPLTILHISDMHVEKSGRREADILQLAASAKPNLILITGDYVNLTYQRNPQTHRTIQDILTQLAAPLGVFGVLGTPLVDLYSEIPPLFTTLNISLLRNETELLDCGHGRQLNLIGLECSHHIPTDAQRLAEQVGDDNGHHFSILLNHSPEIMPQAMEANIGLYLCGHTHGGQVRLPLIGPLLTSSQLGRRFVMGHYYEGTTHLYVSRGIGLEGMSAPRVRLLCRPEMTLFTLTPSH